MLDWLGALPGAAAQGLIWGIMAIGVYITYRILDIADLTVDGTICTGLPYPDFVTIASGYGIPGRRVFTREELEPAIEEMLACDGPFLLDVYTGYDEHVLPMIPPGGDYTSIIME